MRVQKQHIELGDNQEQREREAVQLLDVMKAIFTFLIWIFFSN